MRSLIVVLCVLCPAGFACPPTASAQTRTVVADSEAQFSCVQGQDGWHYGYLAGSFTAQDFQSMTHCGPDVYYAGDAWWVDQGAYWTSIRSAISFPNGPASCGRQPVEQWAVRRWVSRVTGPVTIAGTIADVLGSFDGFTAHIVIDGVAVLSQPVGNRQELPYQIDATVNVGSTVDFSIQPHGSDCNDHARFTATITLAGEPTSCDVPLKATPNIVVSGQPVTVSWCITRATSSTDWIGLYAVDAPNTNYLSWFYTGGAPTGSRDVPMNVGPGVYKFRYCVQNGYDCAVESDPVTVVPPPPPTPPMVALTAGPTPVHRGEPITVSWQVTGATTPTDWIGLYFVTSPITPNNQYVCWFATEGTASGSAATCPISLLAPRTYEFRYCVQNSYDCVATSNPVLVLPPDVTLRATPTAVAAGEAIAVDWDVTGATASNDWIALYRKDAANNEFVCYFYTEGLPHATNRSCAAQQPGTYEFRYCVQNLYDCAAKSNAVTVGPASISVVLIASPTTVLQGEAITVSWHVTGPTTGVDWIGLYHVNNPNNSEYVCWFYTGGTPDGSNGACGTVHILDPGIYEFRYLPQNRFDSVPDSSNPVTVEKLPDPPKVTASLDAEPPSVHAGQLITVNWRVTGPTTATDWIGLYPVDAPNGNYVCWFYTGGVAEGSSSICKSTTLGIFEFRYLPKNGFDDVGRSNAVTVDSPPQPPTVVASLSASPTTVVPGEAITVSWQAKGAITLRDWIGLYQTGSPNTQYGCWFNTEGVPSGSHTCPAPTYPGTFEFRYCLDYGYECVAVSNIVTVKLPDPPKVVAALTAAPTTVPQQQGITVSWQAAGPIVSLDWIGLFRVGSANTSYLTWFVTGAAPSGSKVVPAAYGTGTFEFRYCLDFGYTCVAASNPVTVQ